MKKVVSLTINSPLNYGAILQMFALNYYLCLQGYDAKVLKYTYFKGYDSRANWQKLRSKIWRKWVRPFIQDTERIKKTKLFKDKIIFTDPLTTPQDLIEIASDYDAYIVGSDQVWNPRLAGDDINWFLSFTDKKKIAYAASFGLSVLPKQYLAKYKEQIKHLDSISVREESAAKLIQDMGISKPQVVLDPVFLLTKEQWLKLAVQPKQQKYILCYYMPGFAPVEKKIKTLAKFYAQKYNYSILNVGKKEYSRFFFWEDNLRAIGPAEFLGLIANAEMVITNSFHGTAFSVLFDKKFISVINTALGKKDLSSRIVDLLGSIKHTSSLLDISKENSSQMVNLSKDSKEILEHNISKSKQFLFDQLGDPNA